MKKKVIFFNCLQLDKKQLHIINVIANSTTLMPDMHFLNIIFKKDNIVDVT